MSSPSHSATDVPAAPIGDSSQLEPGQTAIVIGSPLGTFTNSVGTILRGFMLIKW